MNIVPLSFRKLNLNYATESIKRLGQQTDALRQMAEQTKKLERQELWVPIVLPNECRDYLLPPLWNIVHQYLQPRLVQKLIEKQLPYIATWWSDGERGQRIHTDWKFTVVPHITSRGYECYEAKYQTSSVYGKHTLAFICWDYDRFPDNHNMCISLRNGQGMHIARALIHALPSVHIYWATHNRSVALSSFGLDRNSIPWFTRNGTIHGDLRALDPIVAYMVKDSINDRFAS
jgi:hypothetical protein